MCMTKRNIADCVKNLAKKKSISKITIHDIMDATNMSRQSFYYHFKDIYDVVEWIGDHDFADAISYQNGDTIEDWLEVLFANLDANRVFYERVVEELPWARLAPFVRTTVTGCVEGLLDFYIPGFEEINANDYNAIVDTITSSIVYDCMSYITMRGITDKQLVNEKLAFFNMVINAPTSIIA